jgi:Xaa-Pro dipeptidase
LYEERINRFRKLLADAEIDVAIVSSEPNMLYLTGYSGISLERLIAFLIFSHSKQSYLIVPKLERERAERSCNIGFVEIISYEDSEDPNRALTALIAKNGPDKIGVEETIQFKYIYAVNRLVPTVSIEPITNLLHSMRIVKDQIETNLLKKAAEINIEVLIDAIHNVVPSLSEKSLARHIRNRALDIGADEVSFALVQSGRNSSLPHQEPTSKVIEDGDMVVLDIGVRYRGYHSDLTRTVVCGKLSPLQQKIFNLVSSAQQNALDKVREGIRAGDIDEAARSPIKGEGFGDFFIHRTGHGLGLEVHEPPYINRGNSEKIREGMVFTVEPGIYLPEKFGVRIEDNVMVTKDGFMNLAPLPKSPHIADY